MIRLTRKDRDQIRNQLGQIMTESQTGMQVLMKSGVFPADDPVFAVALDSNMTLAAIVQILLVMSTQLEEPEPAPDVSRLPKDKSGMN